MEYHVSTQGSDQWSGGSDRPFLTIQKAANVARAGDTCIVHEGVYRETVVLENSGVPENPIRFSAAPGEIVQLNGTDQVTGDWSSHSGAIYRTHVDSVFEQLFVDSSMMIEARWPNATFEQLLDRETWAKTNTGSRYGTIVDPELAKTGIDWTGATAALNVAHQFFSWTRSVVTHEPGSDTFTYEKDLPGITHYADKTTPWESNVYYLSGKLEALDMPTEWFLDAATGTLYLWAPVSDDPGNHRVEVKARDYGFVADGVEYVRIDGFQLFGCTFNLSECTHCHIDGCHLEYPTYTKHLTEFDADPEPTVSTYMSGSHNTISNSSLQHSATGGFDLHGSHNLIENVLVRDFCWNGSLRYVGIRLDPVRRTDSDNPEEEGRSVARRCTVCEAGNACVSVGGMPENIVEYCHIYDGGRACKDVSLLYTQLPVVRGTSFRYNWVHGCHAPHIALGIRGDDQTRGMIVHHNVVWDCGWEGIIAKGNDNQVHHNTCFDNGLMDIRVDNTAEPEKPWRKQWPLLSEQNKHSETYNNCAAGIRGWRQGDVPPGGAADHNFFGELANPDGFDFRPAEGSKLIGAGRIIDGINDGFSGNAPDVGAYDREGTPWVAGYRVVIRVRAIGENRLSVVLSMPILKGIHIAVKSANGEVDSSTLAFTSTNWMIPQIISTTGEATTFEPSWADGSRAVASSGGLLPEPVVVSTPAD